MDGARLSGPSCAFSSKRGARGIQNRGLPAWEALSHFLPTSSVTTSGAVLGRGAGQASLCSVDHRAAPEGRLGWEARATDLSGGAVMTVEAPLLCSGRMYRVVTLGTTVDWSKLYFWSFSVWGVTFKS